MISVTGAPIINQMMLRCMVHTLQWFSQCRCQPQDLYSDFGPDYASRAASVRLRIRITTIG